MRNESCSGGSGLAGEGKFEEVGFECLLKWWRMWMGRGGCNRNLYILSYSNSFTMWRGYVNHLLSYRGYLAYDIPSPGPFVKETITCGQIITKGRTKTVRCYDSQDPLITHPCSNHVEYTHNTHTHTHTHLLPDGVAVSGILVEVLQQLQQSQLDALFSRDVGVTD